jgi:hypothetical protein
MLNSSRIQAKTTLRLLALWREELQGLVFDSRLTTLANLA